MKKTVTHAPPLTTAVGIVDGEPRKVQTTTSVITAAEIQRKLRKSLKL